MSIGIVSQGKGRYSQAMSQELWTAVDRYLADCLFPADEELEETLRVNSAAGLPSIDVTPHQGKLLYLLAQMQGARRILEIGTLGGYSTIWLARALPAEGVLVTLEADTHHASVARGNIARAGLAGVVELRVGLALETLETMRGESVAAFDFIFIDADKSNNPGYLEWAVRFSRPGTVIVVDNIVRDGRVIDGKSADPAIQGTRRCLEMFAGYPQVEATALQTVGGKGYDGFVLARVKGER